MIQNYSVNIINPGSVESILETTDLREALEAYEMAVLNWEAEKNHSKDSATRRDARGISGFELVLDTYDNLDADGDYLDENHLTLLSTYK